MTVDPGKLRFADKDEPFIRPLKYWTHAGHRIVVIEGLMYRIDVLSVWEWFVSEEFRACVGFGCETPILCRINRFHLVCLVSSDFCYVELWLEPIGDDWRQHWPIPWCHGIASSETNH